MRVAAIYDIHGNLPALDAVLADIARAAVDLVVVGGDVLPGPMPRETIARPEDERVLGTWPGTLRLEIPGIGDVLFCHATPRNDTEIFTRLTAEERLRPLFDGVNAALVVCGHTHMQFARTVGRTRVVNAGSVGMPFGETGAYWLLLTPDAQLRRTAYDLGKAAEQVRATRYPLADDFAANNVLTAPSEQAMLDAFTRAELR
jgi:predicted phosphodiesterase